MRISRNQYRAAYVLFILIAFFIPAYNNVSAYRFIQLAINSIQTETEVTVIDLIVVLLPLLLIPVTSLIILNRVVKKRPLNNLLLGLPFFSLSFFLLIVSFDINRQGDFFSFFEKVKAGFYLAVFATLLLLFSYSKKESWKTG